MGYGISVMKDGEVCHAGEDLPYEGSNVCIGGTDRMSITVTYNYSELFRDVLGGDGLRDFDGRNVKCAIPKLRHAIGKLSDMDDAPWIEKRRKELVKALSECQEDMGSGQSVSSDSINLMFQRSYARELAELLDGNLSYWTAVPSNARKALEGILWMAEKAPDGATWEVCR